MPSRVRTLRLWRVFGAVVIAVFVLAGCATKQEQPMPPPPAVGTAGGLLVSSAVVASPIGQRQYVAGDTASATLIVVNAGQTWDRLTGASSPDAQGTILVQFGMQVPEVVVVPDGTGATTFLVQLIGVSGGLAAGDTVPITLHFERTGDLTVRAKVGGA